MAHRCGMSRYKLKDLTALSILLGIACVPGYAGEEQKLDGAEVDRYQVPIPEGPRIVAGSCAAIDDADLARYQWILGLSEEQSQFIQALHERYLRDWDKVMREHWQELDRKNVAAERMLEYGPASIAAFEAFFAIEGEVHDRLCNLDNDLLAKIESVLAPVQREKMSRVMDERRRHQSAYPFARLRSTHLDHSTIVYQELELSEEELAAIDPVLCEYERVTTPLRVKIGEHTRAIRDRDYQLMVAMSVAPDGRRLDMGHPPDFAHFQAAREARTEMLMRHRQLELALQDIQYGYLPKIAAELPEVSAKSFLNRFRNHTWSAVYPDKTDPEFLHSLIMIDKGIAEEVQKLVQARFSEYRLSYDTLCKRMQERQDRHVGWQSLGIGDPEQGEYVYEMRAMRANRDILNLEFVRSVKALLPTECSSLQQICSAEETRIRETIGQPDERLYPPM